MGPRFLKAIQRTRWRKGGDSKVGFIVRPTPGSGHLNACVGRKDSECRCRCRCQTQYQPPTNYAIQSSSRLSVCSRQSSSPSMVKVTLVSAGALVHRRGGTGLAPRLCVLGGGVWPHLPHRESSSAASHEQRSPSAHESKQGAFRSTPALPRVAEDGWERQVGAEKRPNIAYLNTSPRDIPHPGQ